MKNARNSEGTCIDLEFYYLCEVLNVNWVRNSKSKLCMPEWRLCQTVRPVCIYVLYIIICKYLPIFSHTFLCRVEFSF